MGGERGIGAREREKELGVRKEAEFESVKMDWVIGIHFIRNLIISFIFYTFTLILNVYITLLLLFLKILREKIFLITQNFAF